MNPTQTISDERISAVWDWCSEAYLRHGSKLTFPAKTDPRKTYQWRFARAIATKFAEWKFDEPTARWFIDIAVRYAKESGVMRKGLAILHQENMLGICYERLQEELHASRQHLDVLRHMRAWLLTETKGNDQVDVLLSRLSFGGYCNLVVWYQTSKLSPLYIALSRNCNKVLARLSKDYPLERELLPRPAQLFALRAAFLRNLDNLKQAKEIFNNDWRESCLLPA